MLKELSRSSGSSGSSEPNPPGDRATLWLCTETDSLFLGHRQVVAREQVDEVLADLYRDPLSKAGGRDKLYARVKDKYVGITRRAVMAFLRNQEDWQLHRPPHLPGAKAGGGRVNQPQAVTEAHVRWQIDLIDMKRLARWNNNDRWLLTVIDTFTKHAWVRPLKRKEASHVVRGLESIILGPDLQGIRPRVIQSDNGSEFISSKMKALLRRLGIKQVFSRPYNPQANGQVERFNGTLKRMLFRHMSQFGTSKWNDALPLLVANYNATVHSTTRAKPLDLLAGTDQALLQRARDGILSRARKMVQRTRQITDRAPTVSTGDWVRIQDIDTKRKTNWSNQLFKVVAVSTPSGPLSLPRYALAAATADDGDQPVVRLPTRFYRTDLQRVDRQLLSRFHGPKPDFSEGKLFDLEAHLRALRAVRAGRRQCPTAAAAWPQTSLSERKTGVRRRIKPRRRLIEEG
jgi:transposase InsO family protein